MIMVFKNLVDLHSHTDNSHDGMYSATYMCEAAVSAGLRALAITDHFDCNYFEQFKLARSSKQSMFAIKKAAAVFAGKLLVIAGTELGQPLSDLSAARYALDLNFDFVLGSLHQLPGYDDFYDMDYSLPEHAPEKMMKLYFEEVKRLIDWGNFDSLAHLTYPMRYIRQRCEKYPDMELYKDDIKEIFKMLAEKDKALEINTSDIDRRIFETVPDKELIAYFKECGGKRITVGSDAHDFRRVGVGINQAMQIALDCGFDSVTLYQHRTPIEIPII